MTTDSIPAGAKVDCGKFLENTKGVLTAPAQFWEQKKNNPDSIESILMSHLLPLLGIAALIHFIRISILGISVPIPVEVAQLNIVPDAVKIPFFSGLISSIIMFAMIGLTLYVGSFVLDYIGPRFGVSADQKSSFALLAFSSTPGWIGYSIHELLYFWIFAIISFALSVYGIYVYYLGCSRLKGVSQEKLVPYTILSILAVGLTAIVVMAVSNLILRTAGLGSFWFSY